jgi:DNA-binding transcriptional ArsR family regulator
MQTAKWRNDVRHAQPAAAAPERAAVSGPEELQELAELLADEQAREILAATSVEALSKAELAEASDSSLPTVTRRTDRLAAAGLLREETRLREDGHHDTVYIAQLDRFELRLRDGGFEHDLDRAERDLTDELARVWGRF